MGEMQTLQSEKGRRDEMDSLVWFHLTELTWEPGEGVKLRAQGSPAGVYTPGLTAEASKSLTVSPPLAANNAIDGSRNGGNLNWKWGG